MAADAVDADLREQLGPAPDQPYQPEQAPAPRASRAKPARGRVSRSAPLHATELVQPLEGMLGLVTFFVGLLLCGFVLDDPLVDVITLDKAEAKEIAEPLANILARQKWFTQYGRHLANSDDLIALSYALILYAGRVIPAVQERMKSRPRNGRSRQAPAVPQPAGTGNGHDPNSFTYAPNLSAEWN